MEKLDMNPQAGWMKDLHTRIFEGTGPQSAEGAFLSLAGDFGFVVTVVGLILYLKWALRQVG